MNGEQICFGISEHVMTEYFPEKSEKANRELEIIMKTLGNDHL